MREKHGKFPVVIPVPAISASKTVRGSGVCLERGSRLAPGAPFAFSSVLVVDTKFNDHSLSS